MNKLHYSHGTESGVLFHLIGALQPVVFQRRHLERPRVRGLPVLASAPLLGGARLHCELQG